MYCPGHDGVDEDDLPDRLAGKAAIIQLDCVSEDLTLEESEMLTAGTKLR